MNIVWFIVILSWEVLFVSGTCRNPRRLEKDDRKVCADWWTEAVDGSDVRNYSGVRRCINKIVNRCPDALTVIMLAIKDEERKRIRIRVEATQTSLNTRIFYVTYRSRSLCYEGKGVKKDDLCIFYQQVVNSVDWSMNEKEKCKKIMSNLGCDNKK